ncbi:MAG: hypothetical protein PHH47_07855 [Gallionella sp.]|nr:hypothetical protein [Gallionella sp.]MDD4945295.1 hypothetical protein [Gallionella sp.]
MSNIAGAIVQWIVKHFISFVIISCILLVGNYVRDEYHSINADRATLKNGIPEIQNYVIEKKKDAINDLKAVNLTVLESIDSRKNKLDAEIKRQKSSQQKVDLLASPIGKGFVDNYKLAIKLDLLEQELDYLKKLSSLAQSRNNLSDIIKQYNSKKVERDAEEKNSPRNFIIFGRLSITATDKFKDLNKDLQGLSEQSRSARTDYDKSKTTAKLEEPFQFNESKIDAIVSQVRDRESQISGHWITKIQNRSGKPFQLALLIVLGAILTPLVIKALFYFVLAPLAAKRPPICIFPNSSPSEEPIANNSRIADTRSSAVSQEVIVDADHELLLHPEYIQSSSVHGQTDTKFLLDWSCPLSSLAAGLIGLTRIQSEHNETIVVSSAKDPLSEIALIPLTENESMVFQPRNLVGVLFPKGRPVRITRHWRLWSSHAWLTLQLRYLVFHGPVTLIVTGCRGVRVEKAGAGRRISQALTMGFSANLDYSTIRTETFMPYLQGKHELFIDCFEGNTGSYVYEEMPSYGKRAGITGRGLEGITDSFLKVFGI